MRLLLLAAIWLGVACAPIVIASPQEDAAAGAGGSAAVAVGGVAGDASGAPSSAGGDANDGGAPSMDCLLTLSGELRSLRGQPAAFVPLKLSGGVSLTSSSDVNGRYSFEGLCPGDYRLMPVCFDEAAELTLEASSTRDFEGESGVCDETALAPRVLEVIIDPTASHEDGPRRLSTTLGVDEPDRTALDLFDALRASTGGHFQPTPAFVIGSMDFPLFTDGFRYDEASYAACLADETTCHRGAQVDHEALAQELSLCQTAVDNRADEIWLMGGPHFGFAPLTVLTCRYVADDRDVEKQIDVVGLSYERNLASYLAGYQARAEQALVAALGDTSVEGNPYGSFSAHGVPAGCGGPSFAPNAKAADTFDEREKVLSYCDAFFDYPFVSEPERDAKPTDCTAWGCDEIGFRRYWLAHLPRGSWLDDAGRLNDFWRYISRPRERAAEVTATAITCSSEYMPDWCTRVSDLAHGDCNSGEWATSRQSRGYVEMLFRPPVLVSGVTLYDRACDEQVLAGHVEFSDDSEEEVFRELEQGGDNPTAISFEPKLLSGLRVVIDKSTGTNPGFGEITVAKSLR